MVRIKGLRNERGVLLIEVLIAFFLLSLVMISTGGLLIKTAQMSEDNRGRLLALQAAQSALETIKDTSLTSLGTIDTTTFIPSYLKNGALAIQTNPAVDANTQIATITVTVSWQGAMNRPQELQVSTMKSRF
jgi:Tfp pilus assembly protein PilV